MTNKYKLYVDGGGTPTVENYFSWKLFYSQPNGNLALMAQNLLQLTNDILVLPKGCSVSRPDGTGSNNIAELMALYYGIKDIKEYVNLIHNTVYIYHDSQLCYRWVMTALGKQDILRHQNILHANVKKEWIREWVKAIANTWEDNFIYCHVPRKVIKNILGH